MKKDYNPSSKEDVKQAQQRDKLRRETELDDLKKIISNNSGRRAIWRILEQAGLYRTSFTGNSTTFFNEGQRNMGLWLLNEVVSADKQHYLSMIEENDVGEQNA